MLAPMAANAEIKFTLSNDNNGVGVKGKTFEVLKKEVEKRLGDKITVELHHSGMLFDQKTRSRGCNWAAPIRSHPRKASRSAG
jgi:C4-dicarboxylate-binding protein DctP